ncbi:hypothetical protein M406DRAFT_354264 [Cryphonectria parasitica EP155]|uniref:Uncharacterized protein n=1 Tax=Cryphonectria parasitica (strain ATCC 38755 / EP155) TaxID=660469 RepID=A0A9P4YB65_CRYP1|nr:uncharacterized protein M406DRAFT_354264 [Cryphonectria parasitica EP155]KAF3770113.1 hypothetical protein M406DRAFT_354264 [Cryphonectria parasitica EP155]
MALERELLPRCLMHSHILFPVIQHQRSIILVCFGDRIPAFLQEGIRATRIRQTK